MYELSVALKYLTPRWRQLSVSIISTISILVIALVVWLIVVFFSVTNGLQSNWTHKLITLTAPLRLTPTEEYYRSYYYQVDSISGSSDYAHKSIAEKLLADVSDPYDQDQDEEIPSTWAEADRHPDGSLKDIIKLTYETINSNPGNVSLKPYDFELAFANLRLKLLREDANSSLANGTAQSSLSHSVWMSSLNPENSNMISTIMPLQAEDVWNQLYMLSVAPSGIQKDESQSDIEKLEAESFQKKLQGFFSNVSITELKVPKTGWIIPRKLLMNGSQGSLKGLAILKENAISRIVIPKKSSDIATLAALLEKKGYTAQNATLKIDGDSLSATLADGKVIDLPKFVPIILEEGSRFKAQLEPQSLSEARRPGQLKFKIEGRIQDHPIQGTVAIGDLEIAHVDTKNRFEGEPESPPLWVYRKENSVVLASDSEVGDAILLPKSFRDGGVFVGDRGYLSYHTPTASSVQEQRLPIYVAGFYDQGIIPIGGKVILANRELTSLIRSAFQNGEEGIGNGINVYFDNIDKADQVKENLIQALKEKGLDRYWKVETFREYDFTKDILQQLRSEKNLFTLIATVIIIVACSNIISMLIILVNDKKKEIGILRSMGATSASVAAIFGICGVIMGMVGSIIGTLLAWLTLKNLNLLIGFISRLQGYEMFNSNFYGEMLPSELSMEALIFVLIATSCISLLAGIVPAIKACLLKPSSILRSE